MSGRVFRTILLAGAAVIGLATSGLADCPWDASGDSATAPLRPDVRDVLAATQEASGSICKLYDFSRDSQVRVLVTRIHGFLESKKTRQGITPDRRATVWPTEQIRLSLVPQLLGYHELFVSSKDRNFLAEEKSRANYLVRHFKTALRNEPFDPHSQPFDGMLGYALLSAYQDTPNPDYKRLGDEVVRRMMATPSAYYFGNVGLMGALALAKAYELKPSDDVLKKLREIMDQLLRDQNPDGSFPHAYDGEDVHYSSWIAMELGLISRSVGKDQLPQLVKATRKLGEFVRDRINPPVIAHSDAELELIKTLKPALTGEPQYEKVTCLSPLVEFTCRREFFFAKKSASSPEYDTRGWVNELGYEVFALGCLGFGREANASLRFLGGLEKRGAFPDKWAYPMDPKREFTQYQISRDPRSVIRTSVVFWSLAASLNP